MELLTGQTSGGMTGETTVRTAGLTTRLTTGETGSDTAVEEWIPAAAAAGQLGISLRTMRRWISSGRVVGKIEGDPGHETRFVRADTLPALSGAVIDEKADRPNDRADVQGSDRAASSPDDRGDDRADTCLCCRVRAAEVAHLRAQLEIRNRAEEELRKLLAMSQHALSVAVERPALPPAPEPDTPAPAPQQVRWHWPFGRRG